LVGKRFPPGPAHAKLTSWGGDCRHSKKTDHCLECFQRVFGNNRALRTVWLRVTDSKRLIPAQHIRMSRPAVTSTTNGATASALQPQSAGVPSTLSPADEETNHQSRCAARLGPLSDVSGQISQAAARPAGVPAQPAPRHSEAARPNGHSAAATGAKFVTTTAAPAAHAAIHSHLHGQSSAGGSNARPNPCSFFEIPNALNQGDLAIPPLSEVLQPIFESTDPSPPGWCVNGFLYVDI